MPVDQLRRPHLTEHVAAFVALATLSLVAQFSHDRIVGSDGFFHVQQARQVFGGMPWMPLSIFGDGWVDHHLLFHALLAPLTWVLPGIIAAKVGAALFGAFALWAIYLFLRLEGAPLPLLFALLPVALCWQFLVRLEMPRAQGLSLGLMVLGLLALVRNRPRLLFTVTLLYMWAYQVAVVMIPIAGLYALVAWLPVGMERRRIPWSGPIAATSGAIAGLLVHPHSPRTLTFFWQHVVLKVRNHAALPVGTEWEVGGLDALLGMAGGGLAALVVAAGLAAWAPGARRQLPISRLTLFILLLAGAATLGTARSARFLEYSVPLSCIALALVARDRRLDRGPVPRRAHAPLALLVGVGLAWAGSRATESVVRTEPPPDRLAPAMRWLEQADRSGPVVYHFSWNDFPELVYWGPANRYIVGLDPHFLYLADPERWELYDKIGRGWGSNPSKPIRERFGARWAVLTLPYPGGAELLDADPGLRLEFGDQHARVYAVLPAM